MSIVAPRPFLFGEYQYPLTLRKESICKDIPKGKSYLLQYLLITYPPEFVNAGLRLSPDLQFELFDAGGNSFQVMPIDGPLGFSPAGKPWGLDVANYIGMEYPADSAIRLDIVGQDFANRRPEWVSVAFMGILGWQPMGAGIK